MVCSTFITDKTGPLPITDMSQSRRVGCLVVSSSLTNVHRCPGTKSLILKVSPPLPGGNISSPPTEVSISGKCEMDSWWENLTCSRQVSAPFPPRKTNGPIFCDSAFEHVSVSFSQKITRYFFFLQVLILVLLRFYSCVRQNPHGLTIQLFFKHFLSSLS